MGIVSRNVSEKLFHMQLSRTEQGNEVSVPQPQTRRPRQTVESGGGDGAAASASGANNGSSGAGGTAERPMRRNEPKVGRNDPCPCGSGKKYKKCHGAVVAA